MAADLVDHNDRVEVRTEVPGLAKEDLSAEVSGGRLKVTGQKRLDRSRKEKEGDTLISERAFARFQRVFGLPAQVRAEDASASYSDGILAISLPKADPASRAEVAIS